MKNNFIIKITVHYDVSVPSTEHYFSFNDVEDSGYVLSLITGINTGATYNTSFNFPEFTMESFTQHKYRSTIATEAIRMLRRGALVRQSEIMNAMCEFIPAETVAETSILLI